MEELKMNPNNPNLPEVKVTLIGTALNQQEEKRRKEASWEEYDDSATVGWVVKGWDMFFLGVTGLLTEPWTGESLPGQVEEMLMIGGFLRFD
jgi:hypothetical protein